MHDHSHPLTAENHRHRPVGLFWAWVPMNAAATAIAAALA